MDKPRTASVELRCLREAISRKRVLASNVRLRCDTHQQLEKVTDVFGTIAKLECGARREIEIGLKQRIARLEAEVEREQAQGTEG